MLQNGRLCSLLLMHRHHDEAAVVAAHCTNRCQILESLLDVTGTSWINGHVHEGADMPWLLAFNLVWLKNHHRNYKNLWHIFTDKMRTSADAPQTIHELQEGRRCRFHVLAHIRDEAVVLHILSSISSPFPVWLGQEILKSIQ